MHYLALSGLFPLSETTKQNRSAKVSHAMTNCSRCQH